VRSYQAIAALAAILLLSVWAGSAPAWQRASGDPRRVTNDPGFIPPARPTPPPARVTPPPTRVTPPPTRVTPPPTRVTPPPTRATPPPTSPAGSKASTSGSVYVPIVPYLQPSAGYYYDPYLGAYVPITNAYGYPYGYPTSDGNYILPPVVVPADGMYGPDAVKRFLGRDQAEAARPAATSPVRPHRADAEDKPPNQRGTGGESVALARKFIGYGDANFAKQKFSDALQRYKTAEQTAPGVADGFFREGYALLAMGRYESAAKAWKRGLQLDPDWAASGFRIDQLYGENQTAKRAHIDALAKAADAAPGNGEMLFLLGVLLHFDGQEQRAMPFFRSALRLAGTDAAHVQAFLSHGEPAKEEGNGAGDR
jgi:Tfp pilus assembly protein PilF